MAIRAKHVQSSKVAAIAAEKARIDAVKDYIFTDYRGMTVQQISTLRKELGKKDAAFHVVKNNFARLAFEESGLAGSTDLLVGPTAVAYIKEDSNEIAKIIADFAKESPVKMKGGIIERALFSDKQLDAYSKLPSKKQLLSMFMSTMRAPLQNFVYLLKAVGEKKEAKAE
jgi:large subunit ribosomal protein L10